MNERHQLEEKLQYKFNNKKLLMTAVTHSSYVKEHCHEEKSNERLEFLGDAFFDAIIGEELFHIFPQEEEGFLSRIRATLVCEKSLAQEAKKLSWDSICSWGTEKKRAVAEPENLFWQTVWKRSSELFIWMVDLKP